MTESNPVTSHHRDQPVCLSQANTFILDSGKLPSRHVVNARLRGKRNDWWLIHLMWTVSSIALKVLYCNRSNKCIDGKYAHKGNSAAEIETKAKWAHFSSSRFVDIYDKFIHSFSIPAVVWRRQVVFNSIVKRLHWVLEHSDFHHIAFHVGNAKFATKNWGINWQWLGLLP